MLAVARILDSVLAGVALAGLLAGPSPAQELGGRWYVKLFGGATFPQDDNFVLQEESPCIFMPCLWRGSGLSYDTGFTLGAAAGLKLTPNVAVELEYTYRGADMDLKKVGGNGTTDTNAFMVNGLYRFTPWSDSAWRPYLGAGLGGADLEIKDFGLYNDTSDRRFSFAYQVFGGLGYQVGPRLGLFGEVRAFRANGGDFESSGFLYSTTYRTIDLLFGATYAF